jgi:hypothetical protein
VTAGGGASARGGRASEALALVRALRRQAGGRFWGVLAVQALAVLTEGLGLVLLLPILQLAQEEAGAARGGLALPIPAALRDLETLLVLFVAVIAAQAVLNRWRSLFVAGVTYDFVAALRADLLAALTAARWEALVRLRRAEAEQMILVESDRTTVSVSLCSRSSSRSPPSPSPWPSPPSYRPPCSSWRAGSGSWPWPWSGPCAGARPRPATACSPTARPSSASSRRS